MRVRMLWGWMLAGALPAAQAEILIGGFPSWEQTTHPLSVFASDASGTDAPLRRLEGPATQLMTPAFGVYEPGEDVIYVSDFYGEAVRVYPARAGGDVAPLRVLDPPSLSQTRASAPVPKHGELLVISTNCCIYTYPIDGDGADVEPLRRINWGGIQGSLTQLANPFALTYLPASDEAAVLDYHGDGTTQVVFHARTANGFVAPTRVLKSAYTDRARGMAHDPAAGTLMILTEETVGGDRRAQIRVFDADAAGTDAPLRTIAGPATQLSIPSPNSYYATGLGYDAEHDRMLVAISSNADPAANRLLVFDAAADGNVAPLQVLEGETLGPGTLGTPFAVPDIREPDDVILRDGFDGS